MDVVLRIAVIGIVVALLVQVLAQSDRQDIGLLVGLAGIVAVGLIVLSLVTDLFSQLQALFGNFG